MTLPQNVKDAVKFANAECDKSSDFTFDMSGADWQTILAHLLSQDAEIADLIGKRDFLLRHYNLAESRLAAADALLQSMRNGAFNIGGWADAIDEYFQDPMQESTT